MSENLDPPEVPVEVMVGKARRAYNTAWSDVSEKMARVVVAAQGFEGRLNEVHKAWITDSPYVEEVSARFCEEVLGMVSDVEELDFLIREEVKKKNDLRYWEKEERDK